MTTLKELGLSFTLICVLMVTAFAGETSAPPCAPGETSGPPCTSQAVTDGSTNPGETDTPPVSNSVDITTIAEAAFWSLSLF
jgi:hypothetical protein